MHQSPLRDSTWELAHRDASGPPLVVVCGQWLAFSALSPGAVRHDQQQTHWGWPEKMVHRLGPLASSVQNEEAPLAGSL